MSLRIEQDHRRFKQIVGQLIKKNLKQYISQGEMLGKQGKDIVRIPVPRIDLPHFVLDEQQKGGVSQGNGDIGQGLPQGEQDAEPGRQAGKDSAEHGLEVDIRFEELAEMLAEVLELPRIEPKGDQQLHAEKSRAKGIYSVGPNSLRHFKRTYRQALKRQMIAGEYDPSRPRIVPTKEDKRYRSFQKSIQPDHQAVILYMMDVSGSMGEEQKEIVRIASFWLDTWLKFQYKGLHTRYIIHDAVAKEVDKQVFFHTREAGGTMISSAYQLCADIIEKDYSSQPINIYPFHFSDGDNWSLDDTKISLKILKERIFPRVNVFCYGQVESPYGSGQFLKDLLQHFSGEERLLTSDIANKDAIYRALKDFLGKGK